MGDIEGIEQHDADHHLDRDQGRGRHLRGRMARHRQTPPDTKPVQGNADKMGIHERGPAGHQQYQARSHQRDAAEATSARSSGGACSDRAW